MLDEGQQVPGGSAKLDIGPATTQQRLQILPDAGQSAGVFVSALNTAMSHYQIVSLKRVAFFIAKIGHWSGQLLYVRERGSDL